jgi:hypothetical protein
VTVGRNLLRLDYERAVSLGDHKRAEALLKQLGIVPKRKRQSKPISDSRPANKERVDPGRF